MIYKRNASRQPGGGKLTLRLLVALLVAVLVATMLPMAAPVYAQTTNPPTVFLISSSSNGTVKCPGGLSLKFRDEDILQFEPDGPGACDWSLWFDGSDNELDDDLEDFEVIDGDGNFIFTLDSEEDIDQPAACAGDDELDVDDSDVVLFFEGCYEIFLEGSDIGLTSGNEDIDALACEDPDCSGRLLISTIGTASYAGGPSGVQDEDLVACEVPAGPCEFFFDGSDIKLTSGSEDVDAAWLSDDDGSLWLNTTGNFFAESPPTGTFIGGDSDDVFGCAPGSFGGTTVCDLYAVFNGDSVGFNKNIDGLWATFGGAPDEPVAIVAAAGLQADDGVEEADDAIDEADFNEAMSLNDDQVDVFDFADVVTQIYLPVVNR